MKISRNHKKKIKGTRHIYGGAKKHIDIWKIRLQKSELTASEEDLLMEDLIMEDFFLLKLVSFLNQINSKIDTQTFSL